MLFQACVYREDSWSKWKGGIAKVKSFGLCDVEFIITEDGQKLPSVHTYELREGVAAYIAIDESIQT